MFGRTLAGMMPAGIRAAFAEADALAADFPATLKKIPNGIAPMPKPSLHRTTKLRNKIITAFVAVLLLAAGLVICLHYFNHPSKPVRIPQNPRFTIIVGVGLQLRADPQTHGVVIQQVVPHGPAAEAGIASGLFVTKVDGISLAGKPLVECIGLIRGPVGSSVKLELVTQDGSRTNTVELTRQKIKLQN